MQLKIGYLFQCPPWARSFWAFSPYLNHMRNFSIFIYTYRLFIIITLRKWEGTNQEKSQELIIFYKKNNILYLFLRNLDFFVNFAGKVQYNILLGMKIQEVMKLQRMALGITQQDLADMSEIAISTIKKIESGKGNPSLSTVEKIMDILGMEVKYEIRQTV